MPPPLPFPSIWPSPKFLYFVLKLDCQFVLFDLVTKVKPRRSWDRLFVRAIAGCHDWVYSIFMLVRTKRKKLKGEKERKVRKRRREKCQTTILEMATSSAST